MTVRGEKTVGLQLDPVAEHLRVFGRSLKVYQ